MAGKREENATCSLITSHLDYFEDSLLFFFFYSEYTEV